MKLKDQCRFYMLHFETHGELINCKIPQVFRITHGKVTLSGTLARPEGQPPHLVVILIGGSGPQASDPPEFKPFAAIATHLAQQGMAASNITANRVGAAPHHDRESPASKLATRW
jgi:hypothetical protein